MAKGNLKSYSHSKFIRKVDPEFVDFNVPTRPALIYFFHLPGLIHRLRMRWIGRHIPREDAKWMGDLLSHLSPSRFRMPSDRLGILRKRSKVFRKLFRSASTS